MFAHIGFSMECLPATLEREIEWPLASVNPGVVRQNLLCLEGFLAN